MKTPLNHSRRQYSTFFMLIISLPICLLSLSASQIYRSDLQEVKSKPERLIHDIQTEGRLTWYLTKEIDPYQDEIINKSPTHHLHALSLNKKGRFMMKDEENKQLGSYELNKKDSTLTLVCQQINGRVLREASRVSYTYTIKSYQDNLLILEWQGRHGKIERHYIRRERSEARPTV